MIETFGYAISRIEPPGTLDGGDVLKVDDTIYVTRGGRTNDEASGSSATPSGPRGPVRSPPCPGCCT